MRNGWYIIMRSDELTPDRPRAAMVFGTPLVLFRDAAGAPACFLDSCPHRFVPLSLGKVCKGRLECAYHEWQFDGAGRCVAIPALPPGQHIPQSARAHVLPAVERGGYIWIWPGSRELADPQKVPLPAAGLAGAAHAHSIVSLFPVRYHFLMEHVLDVPHFHNLHPSTILRLLRQHTSSTGLLFEVADRGDELTMDMRTHPGAAPSRYRVFHPCHLEIQVPISAKLSYTFYFFHTPIDKTHTMGVMFQYRNFLNTPILKEGFNWVFSRLVQKAIAEDKELMQAQMANSDKGARSTTAYYFDGVLAKYYKWQKRREPEDLWFTSFEHERLRYTERGNTVRLPLVPTSQPAPPDDTDPPQ